MPMPFTAARQIVADASARHVFPGAVVEVGTPHDATWREAFGRLTYEPGSPATTAETIFDLASLTKVIATTTLAMHLMDQRRLRLEDRVGRWLPEWRGLDRDGVTVQDLLSHSSGLPGWLPLFRDHKGRRQFIAAIAGTPLEYPTRRASVYSDLGFILLGVVLENAAGEPLDRQFESLRSRLTLDEVTFLPPDAWRPRTAPTGTDPWRGRILVGEVHDENAAAFGGVAGHAGLFGVVSAVGRFAQWILRARAGEREACQRLARQDTVVRFTTRGDVPGSSRALGWDTMLPTSSCGTRMSPQAFGHTGFTGTTLWIDPVREIYAVLLTNRVHPSRETDEPIKQVRRAFHDAVVDEL